MSEERRGLLIRLFNALTVLAERVEAHTPLARRKANGIEKLMRPDQE